MPEQVRRGCYDEVVTRPEQKTRERTIIEAFLEAAKIDPRIDGDGREAPDAQLVFADGERVGLEVTELTDPSLKASSSAMKRLQLETRKLLSGVPAFVHVHWHPRAWLDPKRVKETAAQLATIVRQIVQYRPKKFGRRRMLKRLPALDRVGDVLVFPAEDGPKVSATSETWDARGLPEVVQARLDDKEQKVPGYRASTGLQQQWIVIATGSERAQELLPQMLPHGHVYSSSFDRAFLLDVPIRKVWELTLDQS